MNAQKRKKKTFTKLTIEVRTKPEKLKEFHQTLQALLPTIRKEKGCLDCRLCRNVEDEEIFLFSIQWEARENFEHYMMSGSGRALLGAIELLSDTARVRIGRHTSWEGIEILRKVRKKKN